MGKDFVNKLLPALKKMKWPELTVRTEHGRQIYLQALERVDDAKGHPNSLVAVLRLLQTADSRPYAFAGVAYTLLAAAQENDGAYAQKGLDAAMEWLEQAQDMEPDIVEINMIEALIYTYSGRIDDARLILDYLQREEPTNFYLHLAEINFWIVVNNAEQVVYWFDQAAESALTVPQRLRLRARLGDYYLQQKMFQEAIDVFREAVHFDRENVGLWHRMSVAYWSLQDYEEAEHCNRRALKLQEDYAPALQMAEALNKQSGSDTGLLGRLFGRS